MKSSTQFVTRVMLPCMAVLLVISQLAGCETFSQWWTGHRSQVGKTALVIGKRVAVVAGQVALDTVINSRQPDAAMNWQEYAAESINNRKWTAIQSSDIEQIAAIWRGQTAELDPAAKTFTELWNKMQPKSQAEVDAFMRAYAAALQQPRVVLSTP